MTDNENCDVKIKIVNRRREYTVSKKLICSSVPYFKKMFCCDLLESKENKAEIDLDERAFDAILDWVHSGSFFIQMDYVIGFYEAVDYLLLNERLSEPCLSYFHENFTIKHLPVILTQVTKVSKLISSGAIENTICRHFLMIANTDIFLNYPVETVEAILKLDLVVHSEFQIFESIMKWVNEDVKSRKELLPRLLSCVRWSFMDPDDICKIKANRLIKPLPNFDEIISSNGECAFDRSDLSFFVSIHEIDLSTLKLKAFDNEMFCFTIGDFTLDASMSLEFFHEEDISDIFYDSGTKGIRIDWIKKTFRWLDFKFDGYTYYSKLRKFIEAFRSNPCFLDDKEAEFDFPILPEEAVILESNGKFIVVGKTKDEKKWFGLFPATSASWFNYYEDQEHSFKATVLDDVVYILTEDLEFIKFNYETKFCNKSAPFKKEKSDFNDLILTSHQTNDDKVILVNKASGIVYFCYIGQQECLEKLRIMNLDSSSKEHKVSVGKLIIFTSAFLPMKNITPLYEQALL